VELYCVIALWIFIAEETGAKLICSIRFKGQDTTNKRKASANNPAEENLFRGKSCLCTLLFTIAKKQEPL
jgi:hypothetical protein